MTAPINQQAEMRKQHSPKERRHCSHISEITEGWGTKKTSTHHTATHAWLASHPPDTASGQRRAASASMKNGERDRATDSGHSEPLASKPKLPP